jgi:hypothetical protein
MPHVPNNYIKSGLDWSSHALIKVNDCLGPAAKDVAGSALSGVPCWAIAVPRLMNFMLNPLCGPKR